MKRYFLWISFLLLVIFLAGCISSFAPEQDIEKLQANGFTVTWRCESKASLQAATESFNNQIEECGGEFTVELTGYTALRKGTQTDYTTCQFTTFADFHQAKQYYDLMLETRYDKDYKLYQQDRLVILTNSQEAMDLLNLEFQ